jgi:large subunit ribosomal protein L21
LEEDTAVSATSYAVISTGGRQLRVGLGDTVRIDRLEAEPGEQVTFDRVLLCEANEHVQVGTPLVDGATVRGTVVEQMKDRKVIVFKNKRRSTYRRTRGHRQMHTLVKIDAIETGA